MNIGEILIWESSNLLLLIPVVIGLVMLTRWIQGRLVFTDRDWLFSDRPSTGESSLASPVAKIRRALARRGAHRLC
jgi:hypothetical protein